MSTSGVTTFSMTGDELVKAAMRKIAVLGDGQEPTSTQLVNGTQALNAMLKTFTVKGMPLWVMSEYTFPMTATRDYVLGVGQALNTHAPLKVTQAFMLSTTEKTPLDQRTHYDYNLLSNVAAVGPPTSYWYEPLNQVGKLHLWPTPDTTTIANKTLTIVYQRPFHDMVNGTDTLDFPQWWHEAVIFGLAWRLCGDFGVPLADRKTLAQEADYFLQEALSFGTEDGSLFISPNWGG